MGCGASKAAASMTIVPLNNNDECMPKKNQDPLPMKKVSPLTRSGENKEKLKSEEKQQPVIGTPLSKPLIPSIAKDTIKVSESDDSHKIKKPIAFEISLEDEPNTNSTQTQGVKASLPKLHLTDRDIQAKLANTEERWKNLDEARIKRPKKPVLTSQTSESLDTIALKQRLLEKEIQATLNRQRELQKIQTKLARQELHSRQVQERKKKLEQVAPMDDEDRIINVSWGGENNGLALTDSALKLIGKKVSDVDSGKGSSSASLSLGSRSGSGRSTGTDVDVGDVSVLTEKPPVALY